MKSRLTSTGSGVAPDVTSNDPPDVSCESEGSLSDSPPPSRLTPTLHRNKLTNGSVIVEPSPMIVEDHYSMQRIHFGSFYLRMGAVGEYYFFVFIDFSSTFVSPNVENLPQQGYNDFILSAHNKQFGQLKSI